MPKSKQKTRAETLKEMGLGNKLDPTRKKKKKKKKKGEKALKGVASHAGYVASGK